VFVAAAQKHHRAQHTMLTIVPCGQGFFFTGPAFFLAAAFFCSEASLAFALCLRSLVAVVGGTRLAAGWLVAMKAESGRGPWLNSLVLAACN